VKIEQ